MIDAPLALAFAAGLVATLNPCGFAMLPVLDESGRATCRMILLYSVVLLGLGPALAFSGTVGWIYAAGSFLLGAWFLFRGLRLARDRSDANARRVFLASVIYLPLLLVLMIADGGHVPIARNVPVTSYQQPADNTVLQADPPQVSQSGLAGKETQQG